MNRLIVIFFAVAAAAFHPVVGFAVAAKLAKTTAEKSIPADEILRKADEVRCPTTSYFMEVDVINNKSDDKVKVEVFTKGRERTRVNTISPARDRGRNMLMIGEDMWAYIPNLKRSVRVALNQKLTGQAAIGDVSRMRWWGDYSAELVSENKQTWLLLLTANKKGLTYEKVRVLVEKKSFRPLSADYLSGSGLLLKQAKFLSYRKIAGAIRPTEIEIVNPHSLEESSTVRILKLERKESPERIFNQNRLD